MLNLSPEAIASAREFRVVMALSASLFLRQNQSLVMTPQLMQSIQLLQMPYIELNQFISLEIEKNPLLERAEIDGARNDEQMNLSETKPADELPSDWYSEDQQEYGSAALNESLDSNYTIPFSDESPAERTDAPELLSQWKSMPGNAHGDGNVNLDELIANRPCLRDHLNDQIALTFKSYQEQMIARYLTDYLDESGYFRGETDDISKKTGVDEKTLGAILLRLETLDPPGVFARSLSGCLRQQLLQLNHLDPAMEILVNNLDLLARRDFKKLKKLCGVDEADLLDMMREIQTLDPKPGSVFNVQQSEAVLPDVIVTARNEQEWQIELNPETLPKVLVNRPYLTEVKTSHGMSAADQEFLNTCLHNANWLTRSLDQRARTILKVASEIVSQQDAFLKHGVDHLRPLNLKTVADAIKMHESTVSRVTSNKYILTPRGLFELKYFFTVSIATSESGGETHSAESVRHKIRQIITAETSQSVHSDDDLVSILKEQGITLARRTVAKYREAMNLPSSVQRRREKQALGKAPER